MHEDEKYKTEETDFKRSLSEIYFSLAVSSLFSLQRKCFKKVFILKENHSKSLFTLYESEWLSQAAASLSVSFNY